MKCKQRRRDTSVPLKSRAEGTHAAGFYLLRQPHSPGTLSRAFQRLIIYRGLSLETAFSSTEDQALLPVPAVRGQTWANGLLSGGRELQKTHFMGTVNIRIGWGKTFVEEDRGRKYGVSRTMEAFTWTHCLKGV